MKTFGQFQKIYEENSMAAIPSAIHFKHVESRGRTPSPIHFKNTKGLNEAKVGNYDRWKSTNENGKLGNTNRTVRAKLTKGHGLSDDEKESIRQYTTTSRSLNNNLIRGDELGPKHKRIADHIDAAIDKHPMQHAVHVYSGVGFDPMEHTDENGRMLSPAYISASHSKEEAHAFTVPHKGVHHIVRVSLQPGDPAIHISPYSDNPHEDETVIKRGVTLQHNGHEDHIDPDGLKYRVHNLSIVR
jgi:hypothetical protein